METISASVASRARDKNSAPPTNREVTEAVHRERQRIGQELHDNLGQQLTAIAFATRVALETLRNDPGASLESTLEEIAAAGDEALEGLRDATHEMAPFWMEGCSLSLTFHRLAASVTTRHAVRCTFGCPALPEFSDPSTGLHLYRIAQEAVQNALRHGQARVIRIILRASDAGGELSIQDGGRGFEPSAVARHGLGLCSMRQRASVIGGKLIVTSRPGQGTLVACRFPIQSANPTSMDEQAA